MSSPTPTLPQLRESREFSDSMVALNYIRDTLKNESFAACTEWLAKNLIFIFWVENKDRWQYAISAIPTNSEQFFEPLMSLLVKYPQNGKFVNESDMDDKIAQLTKAVAEKDKKYLEAEKLRREWQSKYDSAVLVAASADKAAASAKESLKASRLRQMASNATDKARKLYEGTPATPDNITRMKTAIVTWTNGENLSTEWEEFVSNDDGSYPWIQKITLGSNSWMLAWIDILNEGFPTVDEAVAAFKQAYDGSTTGIVVGYATRISTRLSELKEGIKALKLPTLPKKAFTWTFEKSKLGLKKAAEAKKKLQAKLKTLKSSWWNRKKDAIKRSMSNWAENAKDAISDIKKAKWYKKPLKSLLFVPLAIGTFLAIPFASSKLTLKQMVSSVQSATGLEDEAKVREIILDEFGLDFEEDAIAEHLIRTL